ncbi:amidohydrolase [Arthrobacter crystallopoietes]|uniref:amidohydrolase n=1 Tax=Crystallibacter crystallopoietes TaxID=37928 RepID=UPI001ABE69EF|nr:amidohydrolase [Arthrobacter crystallopoietes]QTG82093.1 amidohydrolase [Arthrobacter crystallopoietes]
MSTDWIFHSGRVFDGLRLHPNATAVAVSGGRITAVGTDDEVRAAAGPAREYIDLAGRLLTPGFTDAHVHALYGGLERLGCDLTECSGADAVLARIAEFAAISDKPWVTGGGWNMADFPGGTPHADLLDNVVPDRPAFLVNRDHHSGWANTAALRKAGITAQTPDPADGRIERDATGQPTGTLHEGAMDLVGDLVPAPTREEMAAGLLEAQRYLHRQGITGWQEAIIGNYASHPDGAEIYHGLAAEGLLTGRATGALWVPRTVKPDTVADLVEGFATRRDANALAGFPTVSAKIMVDGVPENRTAAMLEPYVQSCACSPRETDDRGLTYLDRESLQAAATALDAAGFDLHMHVIGDRAVREGLDAVAAARAANGRNGSRHHMAHIQVIDPADLSRFAGLGVTANAQALWACHDTQMQSLTIPVLGAERAARQYPFQSLVSAGTRLAMGSDWPVSSPDPWQAIHVAVTRREPGHPDAEPLIAAEALELETALAGYTSGSAWLNRHENGGVIAPGRAADLVVHNADPFGLPAHELSTMAATFTMVGGSPVHIAESALL